MYKALYYKKLENDFVICQLCPHCCKLDDGKIGKCGVRMNVSGELYCMFYGELSAIAVDSIEKKPLYHFFPGSKILSIGTLGCNMHCLHCQNSHISLDWKKYSGQTKKISSKELLQRAHAGNLSSIAYTYNEPTVFYEYMLDTAKIFNAEGLHNVVVSNGYIQLEALDELSKYISAYNIDLKAFNDASLREMTGGSLAPVLRSIERIKELGKHLELTILVVPGKNDSLEEFKSMIRYISETLGRSQVLHISRYYPHYKSDEPPTSISLLRKMMKLAKEELDFVYFGNVGEPSEHNTYCSECSSLLILREQYEPKVINIKMGKCGNCGKLVPGKF